MDRFSVIVIIFNKYKRNFIQKNNYYNSRYNLYVALTLHYNNETLLRRNKSKIK